MTLFQSIVLGIIQGITEFLPISSSAHLVLFPYFFGWNITEAYVFPFNVLIQIGSLVAIIFYFWNDIKIIIVSMVKGLAQGKPFLETPARTGWLISLATIPAGLVGLLIKEEISSAFSNPVFTSISLIVTAILLTISEYAGKHKRELSTLNYWDAIWIGLFQAIAVFPGISRSGITITGGMTRHLNRKVAGQFAFLMAIPILFAAGILGFIDFLQLDNPGTYLPSLLVGFFTSAVFGLLTMRWLINFISKHSLFPFAIYCFILGLGSLGYTMIDPQIPLFESGNKANLAVYHISYESDLEWLLPVFGQCKNEVPELSLIIEKQAWQAGQLDATNLFFIYGEQTGMGQFAYQVGNDTVLPVVSHENNMRSIPLNLLQDIFMGRFASWQDIYNVCPDCFSQPLANGREEIKIYAYPNQSSISRFFKNIFPSSSLYSSRVVFAPTALTMRQAISSDINSIGYLPKSWITDVIIPLNITDIENQIIAIPIIATSSTQIDEPLLAWLKCVQFNF